MSDSRAGRTWIYRLEVESSVRQQVQLLARLEEPAPEGVTVRFAEQTDVIPRQGTAWPQLVVNTPRVLGPFRGALVLSSPEVPGWEKRYTFDGEVVQSGREGKSLDAILHEKKKLALNEALAIAKRVSVALSAAAKLGIVHRDIKPHNILLSKDGVVKVADFGLAKDEDANRSISEPGTIMGTPYYMSPEQAKGEKVDPRGDIYSLGATLYHMLTGKRMFDGGTPVSIVMKQINDTPVLGGSRLMVPYLNVGQDYWFRMTSVSSRDSSKESAPGGAFKRKAAAKN